MSKVGSSNLHQILSQTTSTGISVKTATRQPSSHELGSARRTAQSIPPRDFGNLNALRGHQIAEEINKKPLTSTEVKNLQSALSTRPLNVQDSVIRSLLKSNEPTADVKEALTKMKGAVESRLSKMATPPQGMV